jgi:hypothetical protein
MEHTKSSFYFKDKRGDWQVDYTYITTKSTYSDIEHKSLKATVYLNDSVYQDFDRLPNTKTENPTKTQAKEIISESKDKREAKLNKIITSSYYEGSV